MNECFCCRCCCCCFCSCSWTHNTVYVAAKLPHVLSPTSATTGQKELVSLDTQRDPFILVYSNLPYFMTTPPTHALPSLSIHPFVRPAKTHSQRTFSFLLWLLFLLVTKSMAYFQICVCVCASVGVNVNVCMYVCVCVCLQRTKFISVSWKVLKSVLQMVFPLSFDTDKPTY